MSLHWRSHELHTFSEVSDAMTKIQSPSSQDFWSGKHCSQITHNHFWFPWPSSQNHTFIPGLQENLGSTR